MAKRGHYALALALIGAGALVLGSTRPVEAQVVPLASHMDCMSFACVTWGDQCTQPKSAPVSGSCVLSESAIKAARARCVQAKGSNCQLADACMEHEMAVVPCSGTPAPAPTPKPPPPKPNP